MAIAFCAASISLAGAQRPDSAPPMARRGGMMGGRLLEGITLTDAQQVQVKVIREKYAPTMMELMESVRSNGAPPDSATNAKMRAVRDAQLSDIRLILTADQQKILDANIAAEKERRAKMQPPPGK